MSARGQKPTVAMAISDVEPRSEASAVRSVALMLRSGRMPAVLLLIVSITPAFAETKFPSGGFYYVSCVKLGLSSAKEDARPGLDRLSFGFSDTRHYDVDLIVGPVRSVAEQVVLSDVEDATGAGWGVLLSRVTGVLTITDRSGSKEAKYLCERSGPYGTSF